MAAVTSANECKPSLPGLGNWLMVSRRGVLLREVYPGELVSDLRERLSLALRLSVKLGLGLAPGEPPSSLGLSCARIGLSAPRPGERRAPSMGGSGISVRW